MKSEINHCLAITMANKKVGVLLPECHTRHHFESILSDLNKVIVAAPAGLKFIIDISRQCSNFSDFSNVLSDIRRQLIRNGCEMQVVGRQAAIDIMPAPNSQSAVDQPSAECFKLEAGA